MLIEIPDDMFEQLSNIGKEIATQNNRCTARPYIYQIQKDVRTYGFDSDYADEFVYVHEEDFEDMVDPKDTLPEDFNEDKYYKVYYKDTVEYTNFFFTEKACRQHIEENQHHYKKPTRDYITGAWRNPEMDIVVKLLMLLGQIKK